MESYRNYCQARNQIKNITRKSWKVYEHDITHNAKTNPKATQQYMNSKSNYKPKIPDLIINSDQDTTAIISEKAKQICFMNTSALVTRYETIKGKKSTLHKVTSGILRSTVLDPLLFVIYINFLYQSRSTCLQTTQNYTTYVITSPLNNQTLNRCYYNLTSASATSCTLPTNHQMKSIITI